MTINDECFECGACVGVCPKEAITEGTPYKIDPKKCNVCGACVGECSAGAISNVPLFRNTGKFPPSNGDVIFTKPHSFFFIQSCEKANDYNGGTYAVFGSEIYDYRLEGGSVEINNSKLLPALDLRRQITPQEEVSLRELLDEFDLEYDYGYKKLVHKPHQRVPAGSAYWYIDDRMAEVSAVDDGAVTGVHADRFRQWNYFKVKSHSVHVGKAMRDSLKATGVPNGSWFNI